ncbi:MAG: hypothetical protein ACRDZ0_13610 [Acidimicrobiales bacterium]
MPDYGSAGDLVLLATGQRQQARVRRFAARRQRRVRRAGRIWAALVRLGPVAMDLALVAGLVMLATVADRPVFEPFGLDDRSTILVALGVNALIAVLADIGVGGKLRELAQTATALRSGSSWYSQVGLMIAAVVVAAGAALAVAWARARQFAFDTDTLFGARSPGFVAGLALFTAIGLALFVAAAILGWRRREPRRAPATTTPRERRALRGALARFEGQVQGRVDRANAAVVRDAARLAYEGLRLGPLPAVVFPADAAEFLRVERAHLDAEETSDAGST